MKQLLRQKMKEYRDSLSLIESDEKSDEIFLNLQNLIKNFKEKIYFVYLSFSSEAKTQKIIDYLLECGKKVFVPKVEQSEMVAIEINKNSKFQKSKFGIFEPIGKSEEIDNFVAIIPCLAVSLNGERLGYGGGYYDKFLKNKTAKKVAICFDNQIVDFIKTESFDINMDYIVSNKRIIEIKKRWNSSLF